MGERRIREEEKAQEEKNKAVILSAHKKAVPIYRNGFYFFLV